ncbi:NAD(P)H-hydrate epimerase, partial [Candidatus Poribacteria bacterium]
MKVVTAAEMRQLDSETIERIGIPGIVLMETAGSAIVRSIRRDSPDCQCIGVFVGKGNNGGDGLVIARQLAHAGCDVHIFLVSPAESFTGDAATNLQIAQNLGLPMADAVTAISQTRCELFVDAIFGTGLRRPVVGEIADVIEGINRLPVPVIAVDLPSGLDADTGQPLGACVRADKTVTIGFPKRGLLLHPGAEFAGKLEVADIGFPKQVVAAQNINVNWTTARKAADWLPSRPRASHKGSYGRVLVVAGSTGMTGAAALASEAALRIGAGLVTLAIPKSLNPILEVKLSEVMTLPLPETEAGSLAESAAEPILKFVEKTKSVMAIGPGLSQQPETVSFVHKLVQAKSAFGRVIDADGLNALAQTIISHDAGMAGDRPPPYGKTTSRDDDMVEDRPTPYGSTTSRDNVAGDR